MGKIVLTNIGGHVHLLIQGTVTKGKNSVKRSMIEVNGMLAVVTKFGKTHKESDTTYASCLVGKNWHWVKRLEVWHDLGPVTYTGSFKVGDEIKENQYSVTKGVIKLKNLDKYVDIETKPVRKSIKAPKYFS